MIKVSSTIIVCIAYCFLIDKILRDVFMLLVNEMNQITWSLLVTTFISLHDPSMAWRFKVIRMHSLQRSVVLLLCVIDPVPSPQPFDFLSIPLHFLATNFPIITFYVDMLLFVALTHSHMIPSGFFGSEKEERAFCWENYGDIHPLLVCTIVG